MRRWSQILKAWKNNEAIWMSIFSDHYNFLSKPFIEMW